MIGRCDSPFTFGTAATSNVSRPMVRCHEMSHITPTTTLVDAKSTA